MVSVRQRTDARPAYAQASNELTAAMRYLQRKFVDELVRSTYRLSIHKGINMKHSILFFALSAALGLAACERPTVVTVPGPAVVVPGPAGPQGATGSPGTAGAQGDAGSKGATGNQGNDGNTGATGKPGEGTTVIVIPPTPIPPVPVK